MNRKYDLNFFKNKIKEIRSIRPDISITTDIIVGFPGETEELFLETINNSKEIAFSKIHVFPYSERKGTPSEKFPGKVDVHERKNRSRRLIEVSEELEKEYMKRFIGKKFDVLIERYKDGYSYGHSSNYIEFKIKGCYNKEEVVEVEIMDVKYPYAIGERV